MVVVVWTVFEDPGVSLNDHVEECKACEMENEMAGEASTAAMGRELSMRSEKGSN